MSRASRIWPFEVGMSFPIDTIGDEKLFFDQLLKTTVELCWFYAKHSTLLLDSGQVLQNSSLSFFICLGSSILSQTPLLIGLFQANVYF